ncbi:MAG: sigma-70 family RNA polymerase sigma factor [Gemmatimonadota bacterium]|nr:sigma-70 family RNA polymerase sigma factor [Gemmatimonadota bacterium]
MGATAVTEREEDDVRRAVEGDTRAFERLYRAHVGRVYALALRLIGEEWAEDLTQEVFIRAWRKLGTFAGRARFGTWLHRLAVNLIITRRNTLRGRQAKHGGGDEVVALAAEPRPGHPGARLDLEAAMRTLPARAREVFVLYDVEGYTHEEISELMGVSVGTSKSQLHRARMLMREYLER